MMFASWLEKVKRETRFDGAMLILRLIRLGCPVKEKTGQVGNEL